MRGPVVICLLALALGACGDDDPTGTGDAPASHTVVIGGAAHAPNPRNATQLCTSCHGADLRGSGDAPSCYKCHGKKWN